MGQEITRAKTQHSRTDGPRRTRVTARDASLAQVRAAHERLDRVAALARDPLRFVREFSEIRDRELAVLLCALLAFGNVTTIGNKLRALFALLDGHPAHTSALGRVVLRARLQGFVHRTFTGEAIADLLTAAHAMQSREGSLFGPLRAAYDREGALRPALAQWVARLRTDAFGSDPSRSAKHLLPDPMGPSACKRLLLLCRWISREDDGVDLGMGVLPTEALLVPLDVHVHRVGLALGLTHCARPTWEAAEELTASLRALDPRDPVRYDFALCHTEIALRLTKI
ncbi:MAG: DUF2400 family protein [Deltaproteobacteria bacterium]|nr:DUF2400 family protein [Deltaproteobacteria bacterium]